MTPFDSKDLNKIIRVISDIYTRVTSLETKQIDQMDIIPKAIKNRHIDGVVIEVGISTDRPSGNTHTKAWFSTDTNTLSIWNDEEEDWKDTTLT